MMIPASVLTAFVTAAVCAAGVPVVLLLLLCLRKRLSPLPLLCGAAAFFLSQMVLRLPLLQVLAGQGWYRALALRFFWYALWLAFSAGLFEESARLGGALLLKRRRSYKDVISFGLGHGFCEAVLLVGVSHIGNAAACLAINAGAGSAFFPAGQLEQAAALLAAINPMDIYWGIFERFSAVAFHLFATVLVFQGVVKKKIGYTLAAILAHMLFNLLAVLLLRLAGTAVCETALLIAALGMGWYVVKSRGSFAPLPVEGERKETAAEDSP